MRRTKIVATLGPATDEPAVLEGLIEAGVDVVRMNFSHGSVAQHKQRAEQIRALSEKYQRWVAILVDLQGPKIRLQCFKEGGVDLAEGAKFILDAAHPTEAGDINRVGVTYPELPQDTQPGDVLLLDDGMIELKVDHIEGSCIHTTVAQGGRLSNNKGINRQGGGFSAPAITDKDRADIQTAAEIEADYLGVSFPKSAADIVQARVLLREAGGHGAICAKIERAEALDNYADILASSDAVMVARGDLGVEVGDAELPMIQKKLIDEARSANRAVITATQMMQSMVTSPIPTRAEVFDVANAVFDGTDAVMLSGETAAGEYPVAAVRAMARVCERAEAHRRASVSYHRLDSRFERADEAIAMAAMYAANHLNVSGIASLTESGSTVLWMSRISSGISIYALTRHIATARKVALYRGVFPVLFQDIQTSHAQANRRAIETLTANKVVAEGDLVIVTMGDLMGVHGHTNVMKIIKVGDPMGSDA